jgi:protein disulfide-isomerase
LLLFAGSFAAEAQELVWETNVTKAMAFQWNQETVIVILRVAIGADGVFV